MATMKEVARSAGVSVATVSRVINNTGYVSPDLISRVHTAMDTLNYQPSALARSLRLQQTQTIGLLVPQVDHPFFGRLAFTIEKTLFEHAYHCFICSAEENRAKEDAYLDMLLRQRVDGVILVPTGQSEAGLEHLLSTNLPLVLVDRNLPTLEASRVLCNNAQGAVEITRHLLELGHRRLGIIGTPAHGEAMELRLRSVEETLAAYGLTGYPNPVITETLDQFDLGYQSARKLLRDKERPSAIIALTDVIAVGVLHAAAELGLQVPTDLSVTGFDDIPLAAYSIPELTTVAQPIDAMGRSAAELLLAKIANPGSATETEVLDTSLRVRSSTAAPAEAWQL